MEDSFAFLLHENAKCLQAKGCYTDALKELNKLIEIYENSEEQPEPLKQRLARAWNDRGHLKYLQVDFYGAVSDFTKAITLDNRFAVPYYNRGLIHYRMGRYQDAVNDLTEAVRLDPSFEDAKLNLNQAQQDWSNSTASESGQ